MVAHALPALVLAGFLARTGAAKLTPDGWTAAHRFTEALGWSPGRGGIRLVAGAELVLALGLVVGSPALVVVLAALAAGLVAAMTVVVLLALRRGVAVGCGCAGEDGPPVSSRTVVRNLVLLALAGWAGLAARAGFSPRGSFTAEQWQLGGVLLLGALLVWSGRPAEPRPGPAPAPVFPDDAASPDDPASPDDYVRLPVPWVQVWRQGRAVALHDMLRERAQLLVFLDPDAPDGVRREDLVTRHPVLRSGGPVELACVIPGGSTGTRAELRDPVWECVRALGINQLPAAVLLGTDGLTAGGPVLGAEAVQTFVGEVAAALEGVR